MKATWEAMKQGKCGIRVLPDELIEKSGVTVAAPVVDFDPGERLSKKDARRMELFTQFAVWTAFEAWEDAGLVRTRMDMKRVGVSVGSGIGGLDTIVESDADVAGKGPRPHLGFFHHEGRSSTWRPGMSPSRSGPKARATRSSRPAPPAPTAWATAVTRYAWGAPTLCSPAAWRA